MSINAGAVGGMVNVKLHASRSQDSYRRCGLSSMSRCKRLHCFVNLVWFAADEGEMELHFLADSKPLDRADQRHICLVVDDLEEYRRRLTRAGVPIIAADPIPNRPRFFCHDPFGNRLEFTTIQGDYRQAF